MIIEGLSVFHVRLPLASYFEISSGRLSYVDTVLVRLEGEGAVGWGEAAPWEVPIYGPETAHTAFYVISNVFGPQVVGKDFQSAEELNELLDGFKGNNFAKAALETAFWALLAKCKETSLYQLLGGTARPVKCGDSLGIRDTVDQLLSDIEKSLDRGYQRIKIKVRPGWDFNVLERVRERFPDLPLQVDANSSYSIEQLDHLRGFDRYNLLQIEQPLDENDLVQHAQLQKLLHTPICLDESIKSPRDALIAAQLGSCRIVNIKISRVGGLQKALEIHNICQANNIPCWVGGMLESGVGEAIAVHFATLPNIQLPSDIFPSDRFFPEDLTISPLEMTSRGEIHPKTSLSPDFEPDVLKLGKYVVQAARVRA